MHVLRGEELTNVDFRSRRLQAVHAEIRLVSTVAPFYTTHKVKSEQRRYPAYGSQTFLHHILCTITVMVQRRDWGLQAGPVEEWELSVPLFVLKTGQHAMSESLRSGHTSETIPSRRLRSDLHFHGSIDGSIHPAEGQQLLHRPCNQHPRQNIPFTVHHTWIREQGLFAGIALILSCHQQSFHHLARTSP